MIDVLAHRELHLKPVAGQGGGEFELSTPDGVAVATVSAGSRLRDHAVAPDPHTSPRTEFEVCTPAGARLLTCSQARGRFQKLRLTIALADDTPVGSVTARKVSLFRGYRIALDAPGDVAVADLVMRRAAQFDLIGPDDQEWGRLDVLARHQREHGQPFEARGSALGMTHEFALVFSADAPARARVLALAALLGWERTRLT